MSEAPLTRRDVYSARPTIRVNNAAQSRITELLDSLQVEEDGDGLASMELRLLNRVTLEGERTIAAFEDETILQLGSAVTAFAGETSRPREIFRGVVSAFEGEWPEDGPPMLTVLAEDALQRARMHRRTKLWPDLRIADLASEVAQPGGLRPVVDGFDASLGDQVQLNESDLAFLRRILDANDGDVQVVGDELQIAPRTASARGAIELAMSSQLRSVRVTADLAHQVTAVTVAGWDDQAASRIRSTKTGDNLGPGSGRTGASIVRTALGDRSEHLAHTSVRTQSECDMLAQAAFDDRARSFVRLEATAEGNPLIRVGAQVRIRGLSARFDNTYSVVRTTHRFDRARGYETHFVARSAYLGNAR